MQKDGSQVKRLTENETEDSLPVFSPDGASILFNSARTGNYHLYTMDLEGRNAKPLTWGEHNNWGARYASDGKSILFVSDRASNSDVYQLILETHKVRRLTFDGRSSSPQLLEKQP